MRIFSRNTAAALALAVIPFAALAAETISQTSDRARFRWECNAHADASFNYFYNSTSNAEVGTLSVGDAGAARLTSTTASPCM